jgi:hypothetical protein
MTSAPRWRAGEGPRLNLPAWQPCGEGVIRSTAAHASFARRAESSIMAATIIGSNMAFIDGAVVNVALPVLRIDLGGRVAGLQWVVESYAMLLATLLLPGSAPCDRYGRRRIFTLGNLLFALASAGRAAAPGRAERHAPPRQAV